MGPNGVFKKIFFEKIEFLLSLYNISSKTNRLTSFILLVNLGKKIWEVNFGFKWVLDLWHLQNRAFRTNNYFVLLCQQLQVI